MCSLDHAALGPALEEILPDSGAAGGEDEDEEGEHDDACHPREGPDEQQGILETSN